MHKLLSASSAAKWVTCAKYASANKNRPKEFNEAAEEGTAAHHVLHKILSGENVNEGDIMPNGIPTSPDMIYYANEMKTRLHGKNLVLEKTLDCNIIHPLNGGTNDIFYYSEDEDVLHVIDYKYGFTFVDEYENWQLINYAACILEHLDLLSSIDTKVVLSIYQPRCNLTKSTFRSWEMDVKSLMPYIEVLIEAAKNATSETPVAKPNENCKYCAIKHSCVALKEASYLAADISSSAGEINLNNDDLGREASRLRIALRNLTAHVQGIEDYILHKIKNGENVHGFAIEHGVGRLQWAVDDSEVIVLGELLGKELFKKVPITPIQAKKLGIDETVINEYSIRTSSPMKLVEVSQSNLKKKFKP